MEMASTEEVPNAFLLSPDRSISAVIVKGNVIIISK